MVKIFLPEEIPWENKGEAAILLGMLASFERLRPFRLTLPTVNPADLRNYEAEGLEVVRSSMVSKHPLAVGTWLLVFTCVAVVGNPRWLRRLAGRFSKALAALLEADVVLVGHDNSFAYVGVRSLVRYLAVTTVARRLSTRLVVYGASIGPLTGQKYPAGTPKRRVEDGVLAIVRPVFRRWVLDRVDLITLREKESSRFLDSMAVRKPRRALTADLAFLMPSSSQCVVDAELLRLGMKAEEPMVAVTADRWVAHRLGTEINGGCIPRERELRLAEMLAHLIDHAVERFGFQVLLVPHATGPEAFQDDRTLLMDIGSRLRYGDSARLLTADIPPQLLKGVLGRCTLVVGTRTHSLIGATSLGVPVMALTHAGRSKTNGIIGDQLGQTASLVRVESLWATDALVTPFEIAVARTTDARALIAARIPEIMVASRRNGEVLGNLLSDGTGSE